MVENLKWQHSGQLYWTCDTCKKSGSVAFEIHTSKEIPNQSDYSSVLDYEEADHVFTGCMKGRIEFDSATRVTKSVEFFTSLPAAADRQISFVQKSKNLWLRLLGR